MQCQKETMTTPVNPAWVAVLDANYVPGKEPTPNPNHYLVYPENVPGDSDYKCNPYSQA